MTEVIYARVPIVLKSEVETYAKRRGVTTSTAVKDLLQRGLGSLDEERTTSNLEAEVTELRGTKVTLKAQLDAARSEAEPLRVFVQRAVSTQVGKCPQCKEPISGLDLLGRGQCTKCNASLLEMVVPRSNSDEGKSSLDDRAVLALVGGLGLILLGAKIFGSTGE